MSSVLARSHPELFFTGYVAEHPAGTGVIADVLKHIESRSGTES